jgi:hypothetical protein
MSKPLTIDKTDNDDNISFGSDDSITALPSESQSGKPSQFVFLSFLLKVSIKINCFYILKEIQ